MSLTINHYARQVMSSPLKISDENQPRQVVKIGPNNNYHISFLKSKENVCKTKCARTLKKKLKKYKLRRDGKEDPDIINVSKVLVTSLKIKSPNQDISESKCIDQGSESTPRNYLSKMLKQKKSCLKSNIKVGNNDSNMKSIGNSVELSPISCELKNSDTTHTNAFKLMMDSRNKSIGSNSPGKEKCNDESKLNEIIKAKELKAKRILCLEKMARQKGSLENQKIEELRDEFVKTQMLKRAEKLKLIIEGDNSKSQAKHCIVTNKSFSENSNDSDIILSSQKIPEATKGTLKLFNVLSDSDSYAKTKEIDKVTEEEQDFLRKLSPSIRKKENMLSYFKKVPKELIEVEENCDTVIKVKFTPKKKKNKKNSKVAKLSKNINIEDDVSISKNTDLTKVREKRKREDIYKSDKIVNKEEKTSQESRVNERPKRNAKKPTKYSDEFQLTSSDEELHIFTPKKKRTLNKISESKQKEKIDIEKPSENNSTEKTNKHVFDPNHKSKQRSLNNKKHKSTVSKADKEKSEQSNNIKLAPIFMTKTSQTAIDLDAKQKFLHSGVPDTLKRRTQQGNAVLPYHCFQAVVHVQQLKKDNIVQTKDWFKYSENVVQNIEENCSNLFEKLVVLAPSCDKRTPYIKQKPDKLLKLLKTAHPRFPVYRTYELLTSKSQGELKEGSIQELDNSVEIINSFNDMTYDTPEKLNWNEKYRALTSKQIIGNFESIKELKRWLESWAEHITKNKNSHNYESDLSDFCVSDTDTDSKDAFKFSNNILVITGQVGTGKTSCVYAVASELAMKVIEVNASSKRTGKIMLQDLQEATRSHKVNRRSNKVNSSQQFQNGTIKSIKKKLGRPIKTYERNPKKSFKSSKSLENTEKENLSQLSDKCSQEISRTGMSLILIDDADIIFEQDDGFCSALSQLIQSSKRPVILITSSLTCPHLQKFLMYGKIIHMNPLLPRLLGTWLDIMCLADTSCCYPGLGSKTLNYYNGDIRKTINFLQYFMTSDKYLHEVEDETLTQVASTCKRNIDDENSSMSWTDSEVNGNNDKVVDTNDTKTLVCNQLSLSYSDFSTNLFNVWWNMSILLKDSSKSVECDLQKGLADLKDIAKTLDNISFIDAINNDQLKLKLDLTSNPWQINAVASVLENENLDCYNKNKDIISDISNELIITTMSTLKIGEVNPPSISEQRARDKVVSRHNTLTTHLYPSSILDRKALALDYWPFCRTICRSEKNKTDINVKRNNRFCHYMKSVNVLCKNDFFDSLSESLS